MVTIIYGSTLARLKEIREEQSRLRMISNFYKLEELRGQVYGGNEGGFLSSAKELDYMTTSEFVEMLHFKGEDYTNIRNMMAAFVLLAEGEDF